MEKHEKKTSVSVTETNEDDQMEAVVMCTVLNCDTSENYLLIM